MNKLLKGLNVKMSEIKTFCNRAIAFAILELFIMTLVPVQVVSADNYDKKVIYDNGYGKKEYTVKEEFKKNDLMIDHIAEKEVVNIDEHHYNFLYLLKKHD